MPGERTAFRSYLSDYRHDILHHPIVDGEPTPADPYISLPFTKEDLQDAARHDKSGKFNQRNLYTVTEGFYYSRQERDIHGYDVHGGIDIAVPYGTPVVAPFDGYAMSSYFSFPIRDEDGGHRKHQGKPIYFGLGYFIQIYSPDVDRHVTLAHLSDIAEQIPFSQPNLNEEANIWTPTNHNVSIADTPTHKAFVEVSQGDFIGNVGFSGLRWGYDEHIKGADRPIPLDTAIYVSYDEPHVHLDEFRRNQQTGAKGLPRDPYDIYMRSSRNYPTPTRSRPMGREPLWVIGENDLPKYSR